MEPDPFSRLWYKLLILFGSIFFLVGSILLVREISFTSGSTNAVGHVVRIRTEESADDTSRIPIVEFKTDKGATVQIEGVPTRPSAEVGQSVTVIYHPGNPSDGKIDNFVQRWLFPLVFAPLGIGLLIAGLIVSRSYANEAEFDVKSIDLS